MFDLSALFAPMHRTPALPAHLHLPSPDALYDSLDQRLNIMFQRAANSSDLGGRYYAWTWGYLGRAVCDLAKATDEDRYHTLMHKSCLRLLALRDSELGIVDSVRGTSLPVWSAQIKGQFVNEITVLGLVCLPLIEYALASNDRQFAQAAIEALDTLTSEARQAEQGGIWFQHPVAGIPEAINHANAYGAALAHAVHLQGAPSHFAKLALGIDVWFRRFQTITRHRHTKGRRVAHWPYHPGPANVTGTLPSEAIWKAGVSIELPIALAETNLAQTDVSLAPIAAILTGNPLVSKGALPHSTDPRTKRTLGAKYEGSNLPGFLASWLQIGDPELDDTVLRLMALHGTKFEGGWTSRGRTLPMALAHLIKTKQIPPILQTGPTADAWSAYFRA